MGDGGNGEMICILHNKHYAKFCNALSLLWFWLRLKLNRRLKPAPGNYDCEASDFSGGSWWHISALPLMCARAEPRNNA